MTKTIPTEGGFSDTACELLASYRQALQRQPVGWVLHLVRLGNLWQSSRVLFDFSNQRLRVEFRGVEKGEDWLLNFHPRLLSGEAPETEQEKVLAQLTYSFLSQAGGSVLLSSGPSQAVWLSTSDSTWGAARSASGCFVFEAHPEQPESYFSKYRYSMERHLEYFCCSDRSRVFCVEEIASFLPISPRLTKGRDRGQDNEVGYSLAAWGFPAEGDGIPLGETFARLDNDAMASNELSFGSFRVGLLGANKHLRETADQVICFTHHARPTPCRAVWLWHGTEVAHQDLAFAERQLAVTLYLPLPEQIEWDFIGSQFPWHPQLGERLDEGCQKLRPALETLVREFNTYSPGVDLRTVGLWVAILLTFLALAGLLAPLLGTKMALGFGILGGLLSIIGEFRGRAKLRWSIALSLQQLADELVNTPVGAKMWRHQLCHPWGEPFIAQDSP